MATGHRNVGIAQNGQDGIGSGGNEAGKAEQQVPSVAGAKSVNVFLRAQHVSHNALSNMCRQRQKKDDAFSVGIIVESGHLCL